MLAGKLPVAKAADKHVGTGTADGSAVASKQPQGLPWPIPTADLGLGFDLVCRRDDDAACGMLDICIRVWFCVHVCVCLGACVHVHMCLCVCACACVYVVVVVDVLRV